MVLYKKQNVENWCKLFVKLFVNMCQESEVTPGSSILSKESNHKYGKDFIYKDVQHGII